MPRASTASRPRRGSPRCVRPWAKRQSNALGAVAGARARARGARRVPRARRPLGAQPTAARLFASEQLVRLLCRSVQKPSACGAKETLPVGCNQIQNPGVRRSQVGRGLTALRYKGLSTLRRSQTVLHVLKWVNTCQTILHPKAPYRDALLGTCLLHTPHAEDEQAQRLHARGHPSGWSDLFQSSHDSITESLLRQGTHLPSR